MANTDPWKIDETHYPVSGSMPDRLRFLLQYAVLAPSSHNTQPWKFRIDGNRIDIFMDDERWLKVCDDDQRELHISVGCCLENLLVAADHFGLRHQGEYLPDSPNQMHAVGVEFMDGASADGDCKLFQMITVRHTNHGEYDGRPISEDALEQLSGCCSEPNIHLQLTSDNLIKQKVDELVVQADAMSLQIQHIERNWVTGLAKVFLGLRG
jgi:Putative TM nitroreductase